MATTRAPRARTRSTVRFVSVVVPDWLMATTRVSDMSGTRPKPESSVAGRSSTSMPVPVNSSASERATDPPATAAVPCPITSTRRMAPAASSARRSSHSTSDPRRTLRVPSPSATRRPRRVERTESGDSLISLIRKWGWSPRSMSRVVTSARDRSADVTGKFRPSYDRRVMPSTEPALAASNSTICPRLAPGSSGSAGVSPSILR